MNGRLRGELIAVRPDDASVSKDRKTSAGIIVKAEKMNGPIRPTGTIIGVGPDVKGLGIGERVLFDANKCKTVTLDPKIDEEVYIMHQGVVAFIFEKEETGNA